MLLNGDLKSYCANAVLEQLIIAPTAPTYPNDLDRPDSRHRPLIQVNQLTLHHFDANINRYNLPTRLDSSTSEAIRLTDSITVQARQNPPTFDYPTSIAAAAANFSGVREWVEHFPLCSLRSILNLLDFGITKWHFISDQPIEDQLASYFLMSEQAGSWSFRMCIIVVPPWLMGLDEFRAFADVEAVRDMKTMNRFKGGCVPTLAEMMWAKIWDICAERGITRFALTSYDHWIFGSFDHTAGSCSATVTPIKHQNSRSPTIMQSLVFWARPIEFADVGLSSQASSSRSWTTDGTGRALLKRKAKHDLERTPSDITSTIGSGSHRRRRHPKSRNGAPSAVSSASSRESTSSSKYRRLSVSHRERTGPLPALTLEQILEEQAPDEEMSEVGTEVAVDRERAPEAESVVDLGWLLEDAEMHPVAPPPPSSLPPIVEEVESGDGWAENVRPEPAPLPPFPTESPFQAFTEPDGFEYPPLPPDDLSPPLSPALSHISIASHHPSQYSTPDPDIPYEDYTPTPSETGSQFTLSNLRAPSEPLSFASEFSDENARKAAVERYAEATALLHEIMPVEEDMQSFIDDEDDHGEMWDEEVSVVDVTREGEVIAPTPSECSSALSITSELKVEICAFVREAMEAEARGEPMVQAQAES